MILDAFKHHELVFQINYDPAFQIWDNAGAIAESLAAIWGGLTVNDAKPQEQILVGDGVVISTGLKQSVLTLQRHRAVPSKSMEGIESTFAAWRQLLGIRQVGRVSARTTFHKGFNTLGLANNFLLQLNLVRWPKGPVFNQLQESDANGLDVAFRFQDENSFTVVRARAEKVTFRANLDKEYVEEPIVVERSRAVIDFDRGTFGEVLAEKLRLDEWFKGYQHVMRRDLPKVLEVSSES